MMVIMKIYCSVSEMENVRISQIYCYYYCHFAMFHTSASEISTDDVSHLSSMSLALGKKKLSLKG